MGYYYLSTDGAVRTLGQAGGGNSGGDGGVGDGGMAFGGDDFLRRDDRASDGAVRTSG